MDTVEQQKEETIVRLRVLECLTKPGLPLSVNLLAVEHGFSKVEPKAASLGLYSVKHGLALAEERPGTVARDTQQCCCTEATSIPHHLLHE